MGKKEMLNAIGKVVCSVMILILMFIPCLSIGIGVQDRNDDTNSFSMLNYLLLNVIDLDEQNNIDIDIDDDGENKSVFGLAKYSFEIADTILDNKNVIAYRCLGGVCIVSLVLGVVMLLLCCGGLYKSYKAMQQGSFRYKKINIFLVVSPMILLYVGFIILQLVLSGMTQSFFGDRIGDSVEIFRIIVFNKPLHFGIVTVVLLVVYKIYDLLIENLT